MTRKANAILSARAGRIEDGGLDIDAFRAGVEGRRGEMLDVTDAGAFATFRKASDAFGCALDLQRTGAPVRIGGHAGALDAHSPIIAHRLAGAAAAGGFCISEEMHDKVKTMKGAHTFPILPQEVEGREVRAFHVFRAEAARKSGTGLLGPALSFVAAFFVILGYLYYERPDALSAILGFEVGAVKSDAERGFRRPPSE